MVGENLGMQDEEHEGIGFGSMLLGLRVGNSYHRSGWNGKKQFITLQVPDSGSKMTLPYIYITTGSGDRVPWLASQADILAYDWVKNE